MLTEEMSKLMAAHLERLKEKPDEPVTMDYIPWHDCLPDGMLAVLFKDGIRGHPQSARNADSDKERDQYQPNRTTAIPQYSLVERLLGLLRCDSYWFRAFSFYLHRKSEDPGRHIVDQH